MCNDLSQFSWINIRITGLSTDGAWPIILIWKTSHVLFISYCKSTRVNAPNALMPIRQTIEWSRTVPGIRGGLFCFVDLNACNNISNLKLNCYADLLCYGRRDHICDTLYVRTETQQEPAVQPVIAKII